MRLFPRLLQMTLWYLFISLSPSCFALDSFAFAIQLYLIFLRFSCNPMSSCRESQATRSTFRALYSLDIALWMRVSYSSNDSIASPRRHLPNLHLYLSLLNSSDRLVISLLIDYIKVQRTPRRRLSRTRFLSFEIAERPERLVSHEIGQNEAG